MEQLDVKTDTEAENIIHSAIDKISTELREISLDVSRMTRHSVSSSELLSTQLHSHMETGMEEYHAHDLLTDYLEKKGFTVTRHAYGMETAFTAEYSRGEGKRVGFCTEYDGLPG